ncbi:acyltransferase [Pseudarthrobacter sp. NIBRBAC000502772]|uniref:acyltransferase n=1 Tax=Pseudarthrobacter sp. NIBRBAC000502772 TaxID=2590775 RepID=UPI00113124F2|nr:acyltransferase [Pseudarthrobacter sp. NIBRBAC000502772]QDG68083.1 acyltransferase [Pseudarthrobacter sp. NIBRBAC000502772]
MNILVRFARSKYSAVEMIMLRLAGFAPVHAIRIGALRAFGARIDSDAVVYHGFQVRNARKLRIGARTSVGDGAILDARGGLTLGEDVNISTQVMVWTAQHDWKSADFTYVENSVSIGDRAWIGPRAVLLPGAVIGEGAVIAAGSIVRGTIPPYTLVGGVPAKFISKRPQDLHYHLPTPKGKTWWW